MTRFQLLALTTALTATPSVAMAQAGMMTVRPESKVTLSGSSNINRWACRTSVFEATLPMGSTARREQLKRVKVPVTDVAVSIPVRSLACGHDRMNRDLLEAMRADSNPDIRFLLASYGVDSTRGITDTVAILATGDLTVAGVTRRVAIPVTAHRTAQGVRGAGLLKLRMTDFGIKPPVALLGVIRARNEIQVSFEVLLDRSVVVALTRA